MIFGKIVTKIRAFGNNTIFRQQFFRHGGILRPPFKPAYDIYNDYINGTAKDFSSRRLVALIDCPWGSCGPRKPENYLKLSTILLRKSGKCIILAYIQKCLNNLPHSFARLNENYKLLGTIDENPIETQKFKQLENIGTKLENIGKTS